MAQFPSRYRIFLGRAREPNSWQPWVEQHVGGARTEKLTHQSKNSASRHAAHNVAMTTPTNQREAAPPPPFSPSLSPSLKVNAGGPLCITARPSCTDVHFLSRLEQRATEDEDYQRHAFSRSESVTHRRPQCSPRAKNK